MLVNCNLLQDHYLHNEFQLSTQCLDHSAIFGKKICLFDLSDFDAGLKGTCNTVSYLKTIFLANLKAARKHTTTPRSLVSWSLAGATSRSTTVSSTSPVSWSLAGANSRSTTEIPMSSQRPSASTPKMYKVEFSMFEKLVEIETTNVYAYIFGSLASFVASTLFAYGLYWYKTRRATLKLQNTTFRFSDLLKNDGPPIARASPQVVITLPTNVTTSAPTNTPCRPSPPSPPPPPPPPCAIVFPPSRPSNAPPPPPQCRPPPPSSLPLPFFELKTLCTEETFENDNIV